jgi:hypothetical protein
MQKLLLALGLATFALVTGGQCNALTTAEVVAKAKPCIVTLTFSSSIRETDEAAAE